PVRDEHDRRSLSTPVGDAPGDLEPVDACTEVDIEQEDVAGRGLERRERVLTRLGLGDDVQAFSLEQRAGGSAERSMIVDDHDLGRMGGEVRHGEEVLGGGGVKMSYTHCPTGRSSCCYGLQATEGGVFRTPDLLLAGTQEGENRQHAAVVLLRGAQLELLE